MEGYATVPDPSLSLVPRVLAVIGEPEAARGIEDEVVGFGERDAVDLGYLPCGYG